MTFEEPKAGDGGSGGGKRDPTRFVVFVYGKVRACVKHLICRWVFDSYIHMYDLHTPSTTPHQIHPATPQNDPALRLKALTPSDAERWVNGLNEWMAYVKATMPIVPAGKEEKGAGGGGGGRLL